MKALQGKRPMYTDRTDPFDVELAPFAHRFSPSWDHFHTESKFQDLSLCAFTLNYKPGKLLCAVLEHVEWSHDGLKRCVNGPKRCCNGENSGSVKSVGLCPIPYTYAVFPVLIDVIVFICTACRMATELFSIIYFTEKEKQLQVECISLGIHERPCRNSA